MDNERRNWSTKKRKFRENTKSDIIVTKIHDKGKELVIEEITDVGHLCH
jgi:hypothetical protein